MRRMHYAWIVVGVTFVALLVVSGVRAAPGVLVKPLEGEFGWDRASISLAASVSLLTYGLGRLLCRLRRSPRRHDLPAWRTEIPGRIG